MTATPPVSAGRPSGEGATAVGHELIWVRGDDAVSFLDGLLSQDIAAMAPGSVARSFLLAPNGKLRALLWVLRGEGEVGLATDVGTPEAVGSELRRFKLRVDVTLGDPIPLRSVIGPTDLEGWLADGAAVEIRADLGTVPRLITNVVPGGVADVSAGVADALRIAAGEPVMGVDVDESTIPQETGLVPVAVDFAKGCFLGQELVARIASRGHVNRRLAAVVIGEGAPAPGAAVVAGDLEAGVLTTVSWSPRLGAHIGMGLLRREAAVGSPVEVRWGDGWAPAVVHAVPLGELASS